MLPIALTTFVLFATPETSPAPETRKLPSFQKLKACCGVDVELKEGPPSVVVHGTPEQRAELITEVEQDTLVIRPKTKSASGSFHVDAQGLHLLWNDSERLPVRVVVRTPSLNELSVSGGTTVSGQLPKGTQHLSIDGSGGATVKLPALTLQELEVDVSGGVVLELGGKVDHASVEASGGVTGHLRHLVVRTLELDLSGGCDIEATATESATGEASGGVAVRIHGNPSRRKVDTSGAAEVSWD